MLPKGKIFFRLLAALVMCGTMSVALADDDGNYDSPIRDDKEWIAKAEATFRQECSSCHIAYPPGMLPTESWRNMLTGLEKHFGMDASLPAQEIDEITAFLADNSTDFWGAEIAPLRITATDWFQRKHNDYVIPPDIWKSRAVKSPANCPACHKQAERGDFSEQNIKLPE